MVTTGGLNPGPIVELWAWTCMNADGHEGIVTAALNPFTSRMPLVFATEALAHKMKPFAKAVAEMSKLPVTLKRFDANCVVEVVCP
jgi:hypothetical protein